MSKEIKDPKPVTVEIKKTYKFFDENFDLVSKETTTNFTPAATYEEAIEKLGSDQSKMLKAFNAQLRREALLETKRSVKGAGISSKAAMVFLKPYREIPPYDEMSRADQNKALFAAVKANPFLLSAIKAKSLKEAEDDDEDESTEE